jgi:hypothetical protein
MAGSSFKNREVKKIDKEKYFVHKIYFSPRLKLF